MAEVKKNGELLHQALRAIQGLMDLLLVILENTTMPPSSSPKKIEYRVWALPLASAKFWGGAPVSYHTHYLFPLLILVRSFSSDE